MHLLVLTVCKTGSKFLVVAEASDPGSSLPSRNKEPLRINLNTLPKHPRGWAELQQYGRILGRAVFHGNVLRAYERARTTAGNEPLHVLLSVEAEELKPLHWERICGPANSWDFLRLQESTPFALCVSP